MIKLSILSAALFFAPRAFSQSVIKGASLENKEVHQYSKAEWDITLTATWQNPYSQDDIALDMLVTAPSGKKLTVPCYYVDGASGARSHWKARFLPQEKGRYKYRFALKQKDHTTTAETHSFDSKGADEQGTKPSDAQPAPGSAGQAVRSPNGRGILHLKDDWGFVFDNGQPFRGIGENICWESRSRDDSKFFPGLNEDSIKYNYERMLPLLVAHGGNFFRTWMCRWNLPIDWKSGFNNNRYKPSDEYFNPSAVAKLDRLVDLCDSLGLHMMLTLGPGAYMQSEGGVATSAADFFVNPAAKQKYRDRLRYIVARWGYSPAIGAWEFFNEVDNVQFGNRNNPIKAAVIVQWHDEMSTYLKQLDPYGHLVTTSISHRDLAGLDNLAHIDFNQKHIYRATRTIPATIIAYTRNFGKPYVIGEFSYEWDWNKNFDDFAAGMDSDFKRGLWYGLFSPTPILPMSWWWEYFDKRGTDVYIKNVRRMLDRMMKAGQGSFDSVKVAISNDSIEHFAVRCGPETYIYLHNLTAAPASCTVDGSSPSGIYDCETGTYSAARSTTIELKPNQDLILIRTP
ncbi:MAG TPA: DUF5060 domain-containing protein [Puia sp.]|nr:DUF5060 domain-containing protein [Puia sp.]